MSNENLDPTEKFPDDSPTSASLEKTESGSSQVSECLVSDSFINPRRIRASSWDESDEDLSTNMYTNACQIYSNDDGKIRGSALFEINDLKKRFLETLEKEREDKESFERLREKLLYDRRQSPARIRRRTKSSDSSSASVEEAKSQIMAEDLSKLTDSPFESSPKVLDYSPAFYLNSFFADLRSKRISMIDPVSEIERLGELPNFGRDTIGIYNELCSLNPKDDDGFLCLKTRKLSQILEVEESRKDLDKSSEENVADDCLEKTPRKLEEIPPLSTDRSKKSNKSLDFVGESRNGAEKYKSLSCELFESNKKLGKSQGSLTERSGKIFGGNLENKIVSLTAKRGKMQLTSPDTTGDKNSKAQGEHLCLAGTVEINTNHPNLQEKNIESQESLMTDTEKCLTMSGEKKKRSADGPEQNHSNRSGKSSKSSNRETPKTKRSYNSESPRSRSSNPKSPKFSINLEDLKVDLNSPDSHKSSKDRSRNCSFRQSRGSKNCSEPKTESPNSGCPSAKEQNTTNRSKSSSRTSHRSKGSRNTGSHSPTCEEQKISDRSSGRSSNVEKVGRTPKSCRHSETKSPKTAEDRFAEYFSENETPRCLDITELSLPIDILEKPESQKTSNRSVKVIEFDDVTKDSDRSEASSLKCKSRSSRNRNPGSRMSTPRKLNPTPRTYSGSSRKSSSENHEDVGNLENLRESSWKEFEKFCDTLSRRSSISSPGRSSLREVPSQQRTHRSEASKPDSENSGTEKTENQSGMNSRRSISPARSEKFKLSPSSWTSTEHLSAIHLDVEKLNADPVSERTNKSFIFEEDEEVEESRSSQRSRSRDESDRPSIRRLSIINEASFEDLEASNLSTDNEDEDGWERSRSSSRKNTNRSPESHASVGKTPPKTSGRSLKEKSEREKWSELIETFQENSSSSSILEKNFPGLPNLKKISYNAIGGSKEERIVECDENLEGNSPTTAEDDKFCENSDSFGKQMTEDLNKLNIAYNEPSPENTKKEKVPSTVQTSQNLYYFNVDGGKSFGIGEFGDVTCWNGDELGTANPEKPKGHGDGTSTQKEVEVLVVGTNKREKETKTQRQLWTESRDNTNSRPFSSKLLPVQVQDDTDLINVIPTCLKTSKSDNCIDRTNCGGSKSHRPAGCLFLNEPEIIEDKLVKSEKNNKETKEVKSKSSSSESLESEKEDLENSEFECEMTPRLSRSLSDLEIRLQEEAYKREPSEGFNTSETQLLRKSPDYCQTEGEDTNYSIFLAQKEKEEKFPVKSNNWLTLKNPEEKNAHKQGKKAKTKSKKRSLSSPKIHNNEYLTYRKSRPSVPTLKLRNPNCFQNFYKRFIGVFCLTSNSSAATSK